MRILIELKMMENCCVSTLAEDAAEMMKKSCDSTLAEDTAETVKNCHVSTLAKDPAEAVKRSCDRAAEMMHEKSANFHFLPHD